MAKKTSKKQQQQQENLEVANESLFEEQDFHEDDDIVESTSKKSRASRTGSAGYSRNGRPPAQIWVNVGIEKVIDGQKFFVGLPVGIPLDQIKPLPVPQSTTNAQFRKLRVLQKKLLETLLERSDELQPGESIVSTHLKVEMRRVKEAHPEELENEDLFEELENLF